MGHTINPQDGRSCPNCGAEAYEQVGGRDEDDVGILECHNEGCSVSRFWGEAF